MIFGTTYVKQLATLSVKHTTMKTQTRKNRSIVKGIKLTLLTIILQSSILGLALVLKANDLLPADFVNYSDRITSQDSPSDVMLQKANKAKAKAYKISSANVNKVNNDDNSGESLESTSIK
jgi:hypothetical protein